MSAAPASPAANELDHLTKRYGAIGWREAPVRAVGPPGARVPAGSPAERSAGPVLALDDV